MQSKTSYSWAVKHTVYIVGFWTYSCKIHNPFFLSYFSPFENRSILSACPILVSQKQRTNFHNFIAGQLASRWTVSWISSMSHLDNNEMTLQTSEQVQTPGATLPTYDMNMTSKVQWEKTLWSESFFHITLIHMLKLSPHCNNFIR